MTLQSVMAIIAVNLKRIIALRKEKNRIRAMKKGDWIGRRFFSILASAGSFFITELHSEKAHSFRGGMKAMSDTECQ